MRVRLLPVILLLAVAFIVSGVQVAAAQFYAQHNLLSDGAVPADLVDPRVVNAWGLVAGPGTPWWISDNGTGLTTLYNVGTAAVQATATVPGAGGHQGVPTGVVFNGGNGFVVTTAGVTGPARFIFASEDGTLSAFRNAAGGGVIVGNPPSGAVYKGLAIDSETAGTRLYATNFHAATVDVFDSSFHLVPMPGAFIDPDIPDGYAPFGIQNLGGIIYVTYALQDKDKHDDVPGQGHGFVSAFDLDGQLIRRVASKGQLDSPWGLALAPDDFGKFSHDLIVGNFGNGRIHAFDPTKLTGQGEFQHRGPLHSVEGRPIEIDGLWALSFGHGSANNGPLNTLFFTAGPSDESHGLFGSLVAVPANERDPDDQAREDITAFATGRALGGEVPGRFESMPNWGNVWNLHWNLFTRPGGGYVVVYQITYTEDPRFRFLCTYDFTSFSPWTAAP